MIILESNIDIYIGEKLKYMRELRGLSQKTLGEKLGVTFQQIQKYEKGTNRISASRLFHASCSLRTSYDTFIKGLPNPENIESNNIFIHNNTYQYKNNDTDSLPTNNYERKLPKEISKLINIYEDIKHKEDRTFLLKMAQKMVEHSKSE